MTGTATVTSVPSQVKYKDNVGYQCNFTGTAVGTFTFQGSLDYNPGLPQTGGAPNAGNWVTLPAVDSSNNPPIANGASGSIICNLGPTSIFWTRVSYTNASGTGVLTIYNTAKSY